MTDTTANQNSFTLDAWTTAANCEAQYTASQIAWNNHVMGLIEKRVKIQRDITEIQAMQSALVSYHQANHALEKELRQLSRRSEQVSRSVQNAMWILRGELLNPDHVADVWVAFRYLVGQADLAGVTAQINELAVGREAANLSGWSHNRTGDTATVAAPRSNVRALIDWAAANSYMPTTGSAASIVFCRLIDILHGVASKQLAETHQRSAELQKELLELRQQSWESIDYTRQPKGAAS